MFYESGLSINVLYTLDGPDPKRAVGFKLSEGMDVPFGAEFVQVSAPEVKAGRDHPRLVLRDQGPVLSRGASIHGLGARIFQAANGDTGDMLVRVRR